MFDEDELFGVADTTDLDTDTLRRPPSLLPYVDDGAPVDEWTVPCPISERMRNKFHERRERGRIETIAAEERRMRCQAARFFCEALSVLMNHAHVPASGVS